MRLGVAISLALALMLASPSLYAAPEKAESSESKGQADLDAAISAKLSVESMEDLNKVIELIERAIDLGLNTENGEFAKYLLASTLQQRAQVVTAAIFAPEQPDPRWPQMRDMARRDARQARDLDPDQPGTHLLLVRLNSLPGGDKKELKKSLDRALELSKDDANTRYEVVMIRSTTRENAEDRLADFAEAHKIKPSEPAPLRARGGLLVSQEKLDEALSDFDLAIKLDPEDAATYEMRGVVLAMLKRGEEARQSFDKATELAPQAIAAWIQKARLEYMLNDYEATIKSTTKVLDLDEGNLTALLLRAQSFSHLKQYDEAMTAVGKVLDRQPKNVPAIKIQAVICVQSGKIDEAVARMKKAVSAEPTDLELQLQLALLYRQAQKYAEALAVLDAALAIDPKQGMFRFVRGDTYLNMGRHREAVADYNEAVKQAPRESGLLNNMAWVLCTSPIDEVRDGKRAVELARIACEVTEYQQPNLLSTLGAAYAETGDLESAKKWVQKALEIAKDDETRGTLLKELASYERGEPVREQFHEGTAESVAEKPSVNAVDGDGKPKSSGLK